MKDAMISEDVPARLDAEVCRAKAKHCRELARDNPDVNQRTMLDHMADTWDRLAVSFESGR